MEGGVSILTSEKYPEKNSIKFHVKIEGTG